MARTKRRVADSDLAEALAFVLRYANSKFGRSGAPGHCHERRETWDSDNSPDKANLPCAACVEWNRAKRTLRRWQEGA